jgi:hypothetical protein
VQELATEITEMVMTELKIEGRTLMPARLKAMTKGEYLVLAPEADERFGSLEGPHRKD